MPINPQVLEWMLTESNYDPLKTKFLVDGFTKGFDMGYRGPVVRQDESKNLPFNTGFNTISLKWGFWVIWGVLPNFGNSG